MKLVSQIFVGVVVLIIGSFIGIFVERYNSANNGQMRYLDYQLSSSNLLSVPTLTDQELQVFLNEEPIEKLSQLEIRVYNYSDLDFDNVPIYIDLETNKDGEIFNVVAVNALGSNGVAELIEEVPVSQSGDNKHRLAFNIKTANRSDSISNKEVFAINLLTTGASPKIQIVSGKKGVSTRPYNYWNVHGNRPLETTIEVLVGIGVILGILTFYAVLIYFTGKLGKKFQSKRLSKQKLWIKEELQSIELHEVIKSENKEQNIAELVIFLNLKYGWFTTKYNWLRKVLHVEKPKDFTLVTDGGDKS